MLRRGVPLLHLLFIFQPNSNQVLLFSWTVNIYFFSHTLYKLFLQKLVYIPLTPLVSLKMPDKKKTKQTKQRQKQKQKQTKQNKTKQKTKQNKTKQNKTKQNKTKQNKTKQKTKQTNKKKLMHSLKRPGHFIIKKLLRSTLVLVHIFHVLFYEDQ